MVQKSTYLREKPIAYKGQNLNKFNRCRDFGKKPQNIKLNNRYL